MKISNFKKGLALSLSKGFTMIELLIVIAVLGILAVAVLSAINPIEQINRSRDTGSRSDAEQLLSAIDRFYASQGFYPWQIGASETLATGTVWGIVDNTTWEDSAEQTVLSKLSDDGTGAGEVKLSFVTRITSPTYNFLYKYNGGEGGNSTYICFNPVSGSFTNEANRRCDAEGLDTGDADGGGLPADLVANADPICVVTDPWICLP